MQEQKVVFIITKHITVEPLGIMQLASELMLWGYIVDIYEFSTKEELFSYLRIEQPFCICLSITTGQHIEFLKIANLVKIFNKDIKVIAGGAHITYFPKYGEEKGIDYYIKGEADFALVNLLKEIKNLTVVKRDYSTYLLPDNLDKLPFPNRSLIYKYDKFRNNKMRNIMTSRGCPYNCSYCYNNVYREMYKGQKIVRYRSPESIIEECEAVIKNYPTEMFFFADDEFSVNSERLRSISKLYKDKIRLPFHCQVRIDNLNEEKIKILKGMGCYSLTFAIESGSYRIRKEILNRNVTDEKIFKGCDLLKKYRIRYRAENMIGILGESFDDIEKTIKMNMKIKPDYAWVSLYQPYLGTKLGDMCLQKNLFGGDIDLIQTKFTEDTVLNFDNKYKKTLINLQRLFALFVEYPFLWKIHKWLLDRSCLRFYTKIREIFKRMKYKILFRGI